MFSTFFSIVKMKQVAKSGRDLVEGKRILLADDIYTTGSTMDAASGELLAAGAVEVCCISICTGAEKSSLG